MAPRVLILVLFVCGGLAENRSSAEPSIFRLSGGESRCRGELMVKWNEPPQWMNEYRQIPVVFEPWWRMNRVCAEMDCGSFLSYEVKTTGEAADVDPDCDPSSCFVPMHHRSGKAVELTCSDSVRQVSSRSFCSGLVQIRDPSLNQSWSWLCEGALDRRGAEVLCRELGCGAPVLQGALSPLRQSFYCEGNETSLLDCPRNQTWTCSGPALNLTCSDPLGLRLVGGDGRCQGRLQFQRFGQNWTEVTPWTLQVDGSLSVPLSLGNRVCVELNCGPVLNLEGKTVPRTKAVLLIPDACEGDSLMSCFSALPWLDDLRLELHCSELNVPEVWVSEGVWAPRGQGSVWAPRAEEGDWAPRGQAEVWVMMGAHFRVKCRVELQHPGEGFFRLISPTLNATEPAVDHSASFLFPEAGPAHRGNYTCVYLLEVFDHTFSSSSSLLIHPGESDSEFLIRALVLLLLQLINLVPFIYYRQATRGRQGRQRARRRRDAPEEEEEEEKAVIELK